MKKFYSISEIAKFFEISRQTLIYYDKINLFKPKLIDEKNGYRYYSRDQFSELSFLLLLKNTGFSLRDIQEYFKISDLNENKKFLANKLLEIDERIVELLNSKEAIEKKIQHIERVLEVKKSIPTIKMVPNFRIIKVELIPPYDNLEFERAILKLKKILGKELTEDDKIISAIKKENVIKEYRGGANYIGKILEKDSDIIGEEIIAGKCISIVHAGIYDDIYLSYIKAIEYIEKEGLEIRGDSIEFFSQFTLFFENGAGGYMEILIPVK